MESQPYNAPTCAHDARHGKMRWHSIPQRWECSASFCSYMQTHPTPKGVVTDIVTEKPPQAPFCNINISHGRMTYNGQSHSWYCSISYDCKGAQEATVKERAQHGDRSICPRHYCLMTRTTIHSESWFCGVDGCGEWVNGSRNAIPTARPVVPVPISDQCPRPLNYGTPQREATKTRVCPKHGNSLRPGKRSWFCYVNTCTYFDDMTPAEAVTSYHNHAAPVMSIDDARAAVDRAIRFIAYLPVQDLPLSVAKEAKERIYELKRLFNGS